MAPGRVRRRLSAVLAACAVLFGAGGPDAPAGLRVGASGDYAPFSVFRGDAGAPTGFDADVARRFAAALGTEAVFVRFRWPDLLAQLARGDCDVAMSGVTVRPERSVAGRFSVPVAETGAVALVRDTVALPADPELRLAALDAPTVRIGVNRGGHLERVARARFPRADVVAIADNAAVRAALVEGRVDAVVTDTLEAPGWRRGVGGLALVGPFTRDRKAYLMPADAAPLAARLDAWLVAAEREGALAALREAHFGPGAWAQTAAPVPALLAAADERLALMPFVADAKRASRRDVVDRAREERVVAAGARAVAAAAVAAGVPPPSADAVRAFYRAQIDAAVDVQRAALAAGPVARTRFDLERELRPALLRIGDRMARLLVATARDGAPADVAARTREALSGHGLSDARLAQTSDAIRALGAAGRDGSVDQPGPPGR